MLKKNIHFSCTEGLIGKGIFSPQKKYRYYNSEHFFPYLKRKYKKHNICIFPKIWDFKFLKIHNCCITSSVMIKKKIFQKVGGFKNLKNGKEDYDLWLRLWKQSKKFYNIPEIQVLHRIHKQSAFNAQGNDLWLRILKISNCLYIDKPLFYYDSNHGEGRNY